MRNIAFPNLAIKLLRTNDVEMEKKGLALFKVPQSTSKPWLKRYLESVYGLSVLWINTRNHDGKFKRVSQLSREMYKTPGHKIAYVQLNQGFTFPPVSSSTEEIKTKAVQP